MALTLITVDEYPTLAVLESPPRSPAVIISTITSATFIAIVAAFAACTIYRLLVGPRRFILCVPCKACIDELKALFEMLADVGVWSVINLENHVLGDCAGLTRGRFDAVKLLENARTHQ